MSLDTHAPLLSREAETSETSENCTIHVNEQQKRFICKVPPWITKIDPESHQPQVVSFGPYHHGKEILHSMEEHKLRALDCFIEQSGKSYRSFLECLRDVFGDLKESYSMLELKWQEEATENRFLELMLRDGCFMLEIMRTATGDACGYAPDDPIFSIHRLKYIKPYIRRDMLILENQLPMLVLYRLAAVKKNGEEDEDINNLILKFYCVTDIKVLGRRLHVVDVFREGQLMEPPKSQPEMENGILKLCSPCTCMRGTGRRLLHVMAFFRKCWPSETKTHQHEETEKIIRSATELNHTGIQFEKSPTRSLKDISFEEGVLKLPFITVDGSTKSKFLNLMTFERLHMGTGNEITSYTNFMDKIINSEQDVALLHTKGIIQNALGSDKAVAELFNSLCKEVTVESNNSLKGVQEGISEYYEEPLNSWWANFTNTYFRSPWTTLSLIAAIFLFVLTIIQTVYSVLSYY